MHIIGVALQGWLGWGLMKHGPHASPAAVLAGGLCSWN